MSNPASSLPDAWVEKIWSTMRCAYGAAFDRQWECPASVDPADHVRELKALWGQQLATFQQRPNAISFALDNLPPHPPNLPEFRKLCSAWTPPPDQPALPAPPRPVPAQFLAAVTRLTAPVQDDRPEQIRIASRYVAKFGAPGQKLTPFHKTNLDHFRQVLEDYEAELERAAARKADAEVQ